MKTILLSLFLSISFSLFAQPQMDTITIVGGKQSILRIIDEDETFIYFIRKNERKKIPKTAVEKVNRGVEYHLRKDPENQTVKLVEIIKLNNLSKREIYNLSKEWIIDAFNDGREVIQLEDFESGKIIGSARYEITSVWNAMFEVRRYLDFNFRINVKDHKLRLIIESMAIESLSSGIVTERSAVESYYWEKNGANVEFPISKKLERKITLACEAVLIDLIFFLDRRVKEDEDW